MVMGPSCGLVLGDLGADVVKIEPGAGGRQYPSPRRGGRRVLSDLQPYYAARGFRGSLRVQ
jgi:crotonobetainyl-CoA:carnitine CoA-transferase CaiB-like acyl-CoA transferase